jgi:serine protease
MSAPHVSGVAALLIAARQGNITPAEVRSALEASAEDLGATGWDKYYGYGLVNAEAALGKVIPLINSVTLSPTFVESGEPVNVTVQLIATTGVSSVTANGAALSSSGSAWTGSVPASSIRGTHTVNVVVSDSYGNTYSNNTATYKTAWLVGANGRSLNAPVTTAAVGDFMFVVCGKASQITSSSFVVDDGSGCPVTVTASGHSVNDGDFVRARGTLTTGSGGATITSSAAKVTVID